VRYIFLEELKVEIRLNRVKKGKYNETIDPIVAKNGGFYEKQAAKRVVN
jgi:hypothetical protein